MLALKLAFKNLLGAGLRTWLNVAVLSFAFVIIIFYNGTIDGWNQESRIDTMEWETGEGQFWSPGYDRYDPYTFKDAHLTLSPEVQSEVKMNNLTPVLISEATAYPQGRMESVILKGIDPGQTILKLPADSLAKSERNDLVIIGTRMAASMKLKDGDKILIRWRDKNGTFDAREFEVASVFRCDVPAVDKGQIYLRLDVLQSMLDMPDEATYLVAGKGLTQKNFVPWEFKDQSFLLDDINKIIQAKKAGASIMEGLLLIIALLAIFDTQVLSIFRRQKEIGTYIALGMTRQQVVGIFTIEGGTHSILATLLGAVYGAPLYLWLNKVGMSMSFAKDMKTDLPMRNVIYPFVSIQLIIITVILVVITATIVSYLPARKISKMKPTDALKGKLQ